MNGWQEVLRRREHLFPCPVVISGDLVGLRGGVRGEDLGRFGRAIPALEAGVSIRIPLYGDRVKNGAFGGGNLAGRVAGEDVADGKKRAKPVPYDKGIGV